MEIFPYFQASGKIEYMSARLAAVPRGTYLVPACGCSINLAVGKDEATALPSMRATHAHVVGIAIGDLPPCRHGQRPFAIKISP
jgi:hypothetical protein